MRLGTSSSGADGDVARPGGLLHVSPAIEVPPASRAARGCACRPGRASRAPNGLRVGGLDPGRRAGDDEPGGVGGGDQAARQVEDCARRPGSASVPDGAWRAGGRAVEPADRFQHALRGERDRVAGRERPTRAGSPGQDVRGSVGRAWQPVRRAGSPDLGHGRVVVGSCCREREPEPAS